MSTAVLQRNPVQEMPNVLGVFPHVSKIFAIQDGNSISVWTAVDRFDRPARNQIYTAERELFAAYPSLKFDFHVVVDSEGLDIADAQVIYVR
jgi:hypothetical protein